MGRAVAGVDTSSCAQQRLGTTQLTVIAEILGERGTGRLTELLVRWKGNLATRPSWVLHIELRKNATFKEAYTNYLEGGALFLTPIHDAL